MLQVEDLQGGVGASSFKHMKHANAELHEATASLQSQKFGPADNILNSFNNLSSQARLRLGSMCFNPSTWMDWDANCLSFLISMSIEPEHVQNTLVLTASPLPGTD